MLCLNVIGDNVILKL